ncbi:PEPxxWA-CTERM sorting domain-containing protein [Phenylobacterium sp. LH3H17]|uniref:PEPxxWA-CTERM sorting domain-containing protein n=1 Tax=Phenylobacterium sp. LH3H17 TaxID=2903901 RepID=UPI0020C9D0DE|nr:PEPxxWA-CTERM sorting domain-containing protein [Phenylobacterium sp. LH3H17]UTP39768.1 PEPxxWA-CTERM sorting domain-containing protein [Phenylobacterium sp. LH3H17]
MKFKSIVAGAALAGTLAVATAANAAIVVTTYQGTIETGTDVTGLFGTAGADLASQAFTAVYATDTAIGRMTDAFVDKAEGTSPSPVPILSASMTINGMTVGSSSGTYGRMQYDPGSYVSHSISELSNDGLFETSNGIVTQLHTPLAPASLDTSFSFAGLEPAIFGGFQFWRFNTQTGANDYRAYGSLVVTSVVSKVAGSAVPEPATWAMMIVGFGLVGSTLRASRGRRLVA